MSKISPPKLKRRQFLFSLTALASSLYLGACNKTSATRSLSNQAHSSIKKYFSVEQRDGHWWFITPGGEPFYSIGLNHIDPATLRYAENIHLWRDKYQGSTIKWIKESVAPNLKKWGFNTVGWVQEVTVRQWRHSRSFTNDEYKALDMPYCHLLPFTEMHQWEQHTTHFDFFSNSF